MNRKQRTAAALLLGAMLAGNTMGFSEALEEAYNGGSAGMQSTSLSALEADCEALTFDSLCKVPALEDNVVLDSLLLPTVGVNGSLIHWQSDTVSVLSSNGTVKRGAERKDITLTAHLENGGETCEKQFLLTVPARLESVNGMPVAGKTLYTDDFEDGSIAKLITVQSAATTGTVTEENGVLRIQRNSPSGDNAVFLRYPEKEVRGDFITEFTLKKHNANQKVTFRSWGAGDLFRVDWNGDGHVWAYFADEAGGTGTARDMGSFATETTAKVTIWYHLNDGTVSLWVNNRLVLDAVYLNTPGTYLNGITVYNVSANALPNLLTVDDYRYFLPMEDIPDQERVELDLRDLTYKTLFQPYEVFDGFIAGDINLPNVGTNGSGIVWESSDESIITPDGMLHRPAGGHAEVTLRATVISGSVREEVCFTLKILSAQADPDAMPLVQEMIYENDFSDNTPASNIMLEGSDGATTEIRDGALVLEQPDGGFCLATIYFDENRQSLNGMIGVEYTMEQTGWGQLQQFFIKGGIWSDYVRLYYYGDGNTHLRYLKEDGQQGEFFGNYPTQPGYHIRFLFDTENDRYSAWINGKLVLHDVRANNEVGKSIAYMTVRFGPNNSDFIAKMDNLKVYYAIPPEYDVAAADEKWLTDEVIRTAPYVTDNVIDCDLHLVTEGKYGSAITWTSSDSALIEENGTVHLPSNAQAMPEVTLTAHIAAYGFAFDKEFSFRVLRKFSSVEESLDGELQDLSYDLLTKQPPDRITEYLTPLAHGLYGHEIFWNSSNPQVITNAGRVIRPRWNEADRQVVLTATVREGEIRKSRDFAFTVLAEEPYTDPQHMSDEEFFGKWVENGWAPEGKLDYSRESLASVERAVKDGDYPKAKEAFLEAMRTRTDKTFAGPAKSRNPGWAEMRISDIYSLQEAKYYQGHGTVSSTEYEMISIPVSAANITKGGTNTFGVIARYNESSMVTIASRETDNAAWRPRIELTVNGQPRIYEANGDATVRAGAYKNTCYGAESELKVRMSGGFLKDETYKAMVRFDFSDILETDTVTAATLLLHAKTQEQYQCAKEIMVVFEPNNIWDEHSLCWNSMSGYVYNYNGLDGRNDWTVPEGSDAEYMFQATRFFGWDILATEYQYTHDETYAYYMISDMMDFIYDTGAGVYNNGAGWNGQFITGGYPRTIDTAVRLKNQIPAIPMLMKSTFMTPEICTAIMKNIWNMTDALTHSRSSNGNWIQIEQSGVLGSAISFPEFTNAQAQFDFALAKLEAFAIDQYFDDGSYIEGTGGYSQSVYGELLELKELLINNGLDVSEPVDDILHKAGYYNMLLNGPHGASLQYGDQEGGLSYGDRRPNLANWYADDELAFISSFYRRGKEPTWTSRLFPDSRLSLLRSDWGKDALFAFTHVRGGGQHAHADDNAMTVMAYQRVLLCDAGRITYTETDPDRIWGKSTRAHNTVEINDLSQNIANGGKNFNGQGTIHDWVSCDGYDFVSQSTKSYPGYDHRRTITFVKPDFWIVSDLIDPVDKTKENSYKQLWHMLPNANIRSDNENKTIASNFRSGANIILASADRDAEVVEEMGIYDYSYHQLADAKYAYFSKEGVTGKVSYDTVLLPYRNIGGAALEVTRLDTGAAETQATAVRIDTVVDGTENITHYMLDYESADNRKRTFGDYRAAAKLALVREDNQGKIKEVILNQTSGLTKTDGSMIVDLGGVYSDFSFEISGDRLMIETNQEDADLSKIRLRIADTIRNAQVNGAVHVFTQNGDILSLANEVTEEIPKLDSNQNTGIVDRPSAWGSDGSGGNGSNASAGTTTTPSVDASDANTPYFNDIAGHWGEQAILHMAKKQIVQGDTDGAYRPDDSVTRAEMITVMMRAAGMQPAVYEDVFADVGREDWFAPWIQAAFDAEFIARDEMFRPNDSITREEMSKLLTALHQHLYAAQQYDKGQALPYLDKESIGTWAVPYVEYVTAYGLMQGDENGNFRPAGCATRAEMAAVLSRILTEQEA